MVLNRNTVRLHEHRESTYSQTHRRSQQITDQYTNRNRNTKP